MADDLPEFLTLADVAEILKTSQAQVYALVRRKELRAMQMGGRRQWRVSKDDLHAYIDEAYAETARLIDTDPPSLDEQPTEDPADAG